MPTLIMFDFDCTISVRCLGKFVRKPDMYSRYKSAPSIDRESLVNLFISYERELCKTPQLTPSKYLNDPIYNNDQYYNVKYFRDPKNEARLKELFISEIFGSNERLLLLKKFFQDLSDLGIIIMIVSLNQKAYIDMCLELVGLTIINKVYGEKEVYASNNNGKGTKLDVALHEYEEIKYDHFFLFDDTPDKNYNPFVKYFQINSQNIVNKDDFMFTVFHAVKKPYNFMFYNYKDLRKDCLFESSYDINMAGIKYDDIINIFNEIKKLILIPLPQQQKIKSKLNKYIKYKTKYLQLKHAISI